MTETATNWMCKLHFSELRELTRYQWIEGVMELIYLENPAFFVARNFDFERFLLSSEANKMAYIDSFANKIKCSDEDEIKTFIKRRKPWRTQQFNASEDYYLGLSLDCNQWLNVCKTGLQEAYETAGNFKGPENPTLQSLIDWIYQSAQQRYFGVLKDMFLIQLLIDLIVFPPAFFVDMDADCVKRAKEWASKQSLQLAGPTVEGVESQEMADGITYELFIQNGEIKSVDGNIRFSIPKNATHIRKLFYAFFKSPSKREWHVKDLFHLLYPDQPFDNGSNNKVSSARTKFNKWCSRQGTALEFLLPLKGNGRYSINDKIILKSSPVS